MDEKLSRLIQSKTKVKCTASLHLPSLSHISQLTIYNHIVLSSDFSLDLGYYLFDYYPPTYFPNVSYSSYPVLAANFSIIHFSAYRGIGLAKLNYQAAIVALSEQLEGAPFYFLPASLNGGTTSDEALRVWNSLNQDYISVHPKLPYPLLIEGIRKL